MRILQVTTQFLSHAGCWDDASHARLGFIPSSGNKPHLEIELPIL